MRAVLAAVDRHPRHVLLFAVTAGLLTGPLSPAATLAVAAAAAAIVAASRAVAWPASPRCVEARRLSSPLPFIAAAAVLAGAGVADLRLAALEGGSLPHLHGRSVSGRATLLEPVRERAVGPAVARARLVGGPADGEVVVLRVRGAGSWPEVGEIVAVEGEVAPLGLFDAYQRRRGAGAALEVSGLRRTGERRGGLAGVVDTVRRRAEAGLVRGLRQEEAALLRGMVLGQDERLTDDVRDEFKRSGLAHVLAVSGQNVMLLATLVLAAGGLVGAPLRTRLLVALALVALYVPLTGAGPSIQRAGVMGAAGLVAALAGRPAHRWYALGLAAAVTLALNPLAVGEPGWQLSFAAVVALLAIAPPLRAVLARRMPGPVADVAAITIAATLGTAPLMALHFEQVSLAALPANLLAAAAIAPVMWLGMLAAAAAQVAPVLALPFNALNAPLLAFVEWVAHTFAAAPASVVPVRIGSPAALAGVYAALVAAMLGVRAAWRRVPAIELRRSHRAVAALAAVALTGPRLRGRARRRAARRLRPASSWSRSSTSGRATRRCSRRTASPSWWTPGRPAGRSCGGCRRPASSGSTRSSSPTRRPTTRARRSRSCGGSRRGWSSTAARAGRRACRKVWPAPPARGRIPAHAGQVLTLGGIRMRLLWPPPPGPGFRPEGDPNGRAVVAHVESGDFDLLLPADAESDVTAALDLPDVEALKVAHHGSADEGLPALLERTRPEFAAIEVGRDNTYGHPAPSTLAALRAVDHVYRTDRDGTVRLRVRGGAITVDD